MENELGVVINATPEQVWRVLADLSRLPQWLTREGPFPYVVKTERLISAGEMWQADAIDGQKAEYTVSVWDEPQQLGYELTGVEDSVPLNVEQRHQFDLDIDEGGTLVSWRIDWQLYEENFVAGWLQNRQLGRNIETMQRYSLLRLKEIIDEERTNDEPDELSETETDSD